MDVHHWPFCVSAQATKRRPMARNGFDRRRGKADGGTDALAVEVSTRLAGMFMEIDELMTAVKSPAAKRRLPLATRLQLHAKAVDCRLKAVQMMFAVYEGLPDSGPLKPVKDPHFEFLDKCHPKLTKEYVAWLREYLERSRPSGESLRW
jgi:hypothetical protein